MECFTQAVSATRFKSLHYNWVQVLRTIFRVIPVIMALTLVSDMWLMEAALVLVLVLYWFMTRHFGLWKKLGVPYMEPWPFVGSFGRVLIGGEHMGEPVTECYHKAGDAPFMGMFAFDKPLLMVKDPQLIGRIMSTDFDKFYALNSKLDPEVDPLIGISLIGQEGLGWKKLRLLLSPAFSARKIKLMFHLIKEVGQILAHQLEATVSRGEAVEVKDFMDRYTTDVVCSVFMGVDAGSLADGNAPLRLHIRNLFEENLVGRLTMTLTNFSPNLLSVFRLRVSSKEGEDQFVNNISKLLEHRKKEGIVRNDVVDILMKILESQKSDGEIVDEECATDRSKISNVEFRMTDKFVAAQLLSFLRAGYDSSSSTLSFALLELSRNQELQQQVRQHVRETLRKQGGDVTYEAISDMTDLTNVVNETLRMYPPANFIDREATEDYLIPGTDIVLPKGNGIVVSVTGLHYDPRYWQQPHRFMPDRFKPENSNDRPGYTFLPFGAGPRMCVGTRLGYLQVKSGLVYILNNFEVYPVPETPSTVSFEMTKLICTPAGKVLLGFRKIPLL